MKRTAWLAGLALLLGIRSDVVSQEAPPPSLFGEVVDVRLVNIEVVVKDRRGELVQGLGPQDFRLLVDGKEVEISNFSEVRAGEVALPAAAGPEAGPAPVIAGRVATRYLVFIDDFFAVARHRNLVLDKLAEQVEALAPGDTMAFAAFDGRKLEVIGGWSGSPPELLAAIEKAKARRAYGVMQRVRRTSMVDDPGAGEPLVLPQWVPQDLKLNVAQRGYANELKHHLENTIGAARAAMRALSGVEGRKVLLVLSGGWPYSVGEAAGAATTFPETGIAQGDKLYLPLIDAANLLGFTIYPVDLPGLSAVGPDPALEDAGLLSAASPGPGPSGSGSNPALGPGSPAAASLLAESNLDSTLSYLAQETGGRAMLNSLRDNALETVALDTRSYYWLGFVPDRRRDDRQHEVEVRTRDRSLDARFRRSFHDLSRGAELSMRIEGALLLGQTPGSRPLPVQVGQVRDRGKKMEVPLLVGIPVEEITILKIGDEYVAELELRIGALDSRANMTPVQTTPLRLASKNQPRAGRLVRYDTTLELWREPHDLVVALFDPATDKLLSTRLNVVPP